VKRPPTIVSGNPMRVVNRGRSRIEDRMLFTYQELMTRIASAYAEPDEKHRDYLHTVSALRTFGDPRDWISTAIAGTLLQVRLIALDEA